MIEDVDEVAPGRADGSGAADRAGAARHAIAGSGGWPELTPPVGVADGPLGEAQAADRAIARAVAVRARALAEFARSRPVSADRAQGEAGAMSPERWAARPEALSEVSEWAVPEVVVALSVSEVMAQRLLAEALTLVGRLPGTLAALDAGALHAGHVRPMVEHVAPVADEAVRARVETGLLRWAAGRVVTPAQLSARARREVARCDARAAARRLARALARRGVDVRPEGPDGMAALTAWLTLPEARALHAALGAYADALPDEPADGRSRRQKMADCLVDLVLRPGETGLPPVQVVLHVVASLATLAGGDEPGEVDGQPVPAEMIRRLLAALAGTDTDADTDTADVDRHAPPERQPAADAAPASGPPAREAPGGAAPAREVPVPVGDVSSAAAPAPAASPSGRADARAWQEVEQEELSRWLDECERRVLAGALDPGPDRPPGLDATGPPAWVPDLGPPGWTHAPPGWPLPPDWEVPDHLPPEWAGAAAPDSRAGPAPGLAAAAPAIDPDHGADHDPDPAAPGCDERWWAAADRAVDEAGLAVRRAGRAVAHAATLVESAAAADVADEAAWRARPGRCIDAEADALPVLRACTAAQRRSLVALLGATGGGGLAERPRLLLTDALGGALLALTDLAGLRAAGSCGAPACRRQAAGCPHDLSSRPGLGPPPPADGYRPSAALDRFVRARDRRCRFPGCRRPVPRGGELDHHQPYPAGPTSAANLVGYCTGHHRAKHQAAGWRHTLLPGAALAVTTPSGLTTTTDPPPY